MALAEADDMAEVSGFFPILCPVWLSDQEASCSCLSLY